MNTLDVPLHVWRNVLVLTMKRLQENMEIDASRLPLRASPLLVTSTS